MLQMDPDPQFDERKWQAWIRKNHALDEVRFARRLRVIGILAVSLAVSAMLWKFI